MLGILTLLSTLVIVSSRRSVLEIVVNGFHPRIFANASLGLNLDYEKNGNQCYDDGTLKSRTYYSDPKSNRMTYTPNRRIQASTLTDGLHQQLKLAVVLVVGGHSNTHYDYGPGGSINGLLAVWDSWLEYFFSPSSNTSSLVLLFDERDFLKQNLSKTRNEYLDSILIKNMGAELVDCAHIRPAGVKNKHRGPILGCGPELLLDQQYRVYFIDIPNSNYSRTFQPFVPVPEVDPRDKRKGVQRTPFPSPSPTAAIPIDYSHQRPLMIFVALHRFPIPSWAAGQVEEELFAHWKPGRLNRRYPTNYGYTKLTNWYAYHLLQLRLLDFFDYAAKLDNDVSFVAPFPTPNLPLRLAQHEAMMLMTTRQWYYDDPRISQGVQVCLTSYLQDQAKQCRLSSTPNTLSLNSQQQEQEQQQEKQALRAGGNNDSTFFETSFNTTFRAHFLVYWLGLYTAPETVKMARHWNDWHPRGMWDYRWGDQQWWPRPIAMLGSGRLDKEIIHAEEFDSENGLYVVHKLWPHYATVPKVIYFDPKQGLSKEERWQRYKQAAKAYGNYR